MPNLLDLKVNSSSLVNIYVLLPQYFYSPCLHPLVEDVNLVLTTNNLEPLYGLHLSQSSISKEKQITDTVDSVQKASAIQLGNNFWLICFQEFSPHIYWL